MCPLTHPSTSAQERASTRLNHGQPMASRAWPPAACLAMYFKPTRSTISTARLPKHQTSSLAARVIHVLSVCRKQPVLARVCFLRRSPRHRNYNFAALSRRGSRTIAVRRDAGRQRARTATGTRTREQVASLRSRTCGRRGGHSVHASETAAGRVPASADVRSVARTHPPSAYLSSRNGPLRNDPRPAPRPFRHPTPRPVYTRTRWVCPRPRAAAACAHGGTVCATAKLEGVFHAAARRAPTHQRYETATDGYPVDAVV